MATSGWMQRVDLGDGRGLPIRRGSAPSASPGRSPGGCRARGGSGRRTIRPPRARWRRAALRLDITDQVGPAADRLLQAPRAKASSAAPSCLRKGKATVGRLNTAGARTRAS